MYLMQGIQNLRRFRYVLTLMFIRLFNTAQAHRPEASEVLVMRPRLTRVDARFEAGIGCERF